MRLFLLLWFVAFVIAGDIFRCNAHDKKIFKAHGVNFTSAKFRIFGGMFVTQSAFEHKIAQATGLSLACATCYGDSYTCGYDNCKFRCALEGDSCTSCLHDAHCIEKCNQCTGFIPAT